MVLGMRRPPLAFGPLFAWAVCAVLVASCVVALCGCGTGARTVTASGHGETEKTVTVRRKGQEGATGAEAVRGGSHATLRYLGQASVRIVTPEGKVIYIDPYAGEGDDYALAADLILVTHGHFDHCAVERVGNLSDGCELITYEEAVVAGRHPVFDLGYVSVRPVQAGFNPLHDVNACVGYVLTLSDGTVVYVTGDTSTTDDMRDGTLAAMGIDYAFWCCDGVYNMGPEEAAEAAAMVGARHNIAYHNSTSDTGERFDRAAAERFAAPNAMVAYPGEDIELQAPVRSET